MHEQDKTLSERLAEAQAEACRLRAEAFIDYCPTVAGERLQPVTLATYNALQAFGNAFVTGAEVTFVDIVNFIWLHSPEFGQFNREAKKRLTRRILSALRPALPTANTTLRTLAQFPRLGKLRRLTVKTEAERFAEAVAEIRRIIFEATAEIPTEDGQGEPLPFSSQAYILNLFRRHLGLGFEETSAMPLRRLSQHLRELLAHLSQGKALLLSRKEAAIWREHMGERADTDTRA